MRTVATGTAPGQAKRSLERTLVRDAMHRGVVACRPDASLAAVARTMAAHRIHCVVMRDEGALVRVVTDVDLVAAVSRDSSTARRAGAIAAAPAVTVIPDETVGRAAALMRLHGTTHVVVVDPSSGRPVGVLSTLDVADVIAERE